MAFDLVGRVSRAVLVLLVPAAVIGGLLAGGPGALGALAGGLLSLVSLHWIARGVRGAAGTSTGGRTHPLWAISLGLRYALMFGALSLLLASGVAHPVALMVGLSILPPVLIAFGLSAARSAPDITEER